MRIIDSLAAPDFNPLNEAIISGAHPTGQPASEWGTGQSCPDPLPAVQVLSTSNTLITLAVDAGNGPAYLVYSATAYPGWKAEVDGRPAVLRRTDGALLGIFLPSGKHRITLLYAPEVFRLGEFLSLWACAALASGVSVCLLHRRNWALQEKHRHKGRNRLPI